jgi:hypothetical protein
LRYVVSALVIGALHFVASIAALFVWGGSVMSRFDGRSPQVIDHLLDAAAAVLYFPLVQFVVLIPGRQWGEGNLIFLLNSALWAGLLAFLLGRFRSPRRA